MKELKKMKETLVTAVQGQLGNLAQANTHELGCAIDMIKDLSEAIYYCEIVDSMKEAAEEKEEMMKMMKYSSGGSQQSQSPQAMMYFHERIREPYFDEMRDMDRHRGRMYYSEGGSSSNGRGNSSGESGNGVRGYSEPTYTSSSDAYTGRSGNRRRTYMESKRMNTDKNTHIKELDAYAQELTSDILEMIHEAGPEEKQLLKKKMTELASKIV